MKKLDSKIENYDVFKQNLDGNFYIYLHITLDEDIPFYVGKGKKDRCKNHLDKSEWWNNIVNKHDYYIRILDVNLSEEEAFEKEKEYISFFGRRNLKEGGTLVNLTNGGEGVSGRIYSDEEREFISKKFKENPEMWTSGNRKNFFGKSLFGAENPNFGNTGESNPLSKKVVKISLNDEFIEIYSSTKEAGVSNSVTPSSISGCCLGKRHQLKGFKYVYLDDYENNNYKITSGKTSKKVVYQIDIFTGEVLKTYESCAETKKDGFAPRNVSQVCNGDKKTHKGFMWRY